MSATPLEVTREELHFRRVDMRGYRRSDGLYEVTGQITDRKTNEFKSPNGPRVVPAGEAVHDMGVTLVYDTDMLVHEVHAFTNSAPYDECFDAGATLQVLKGLRMASGWSSEVRKRLGGAKSCTHLMDILAPMATTAYQTLTMVRAARPESLNAEGRPVKIDSCYAYAATRDLVKRKWPTFHIEPEASDGSGAATRP